MCENWTHNVEGQMVINSLTGYKNKVQFYNGILFCIKSKDTFSYVIPLTENDLQQSE